MMLVVMPAAAQPAAGADLSLIEPVLGACRLADLSMTMHDTHCFDAVDDGPHVRDRHEVSENGKTVYPGETICSADERSMIFTCVNSLGGVGRGSAEPEQGGLKSAGVDARIATRQTAGSGGRMAVISPTYEVGPAGSAGGGTIVRKSRRLQP